MSHNAQFIIDKENIRLRNLELQFDNACSVEEQTWIRTEIEIEKNYIDKLKQETV